MACNACSFAASSSGAQPQQHCAGCTSSPDWKSIWSTTPETSSDRSAPFTARRLPTASICGCQSCSPAVTVETVCGGLAIEAMTCWIMCALKF